MSVGEGLPIRGTCYGYEIRSDLVFSYLREGRGEPLEVATRLEAPSRLQVPPAREDGGGHPGELLREWLPPRVPTHVRLFGRDDGYRVWVNGGGWFDVDPKGPRVTLPRNGDPIRREERLWGLPILICFLGRGDLPLHAAAVETEHGALLLGAPSRFGKTTLAAAFAAAGHRILSEDLTCLRPGPVPAVIPGPAMLRVRRDVAQAIDLEGFREVGRDSDRVHVSIQTARGTCAPVPLAGLALLNEGETNPRIVEVTGADVVRNLWALSFNYARPDDRARSFRAVAELASTTRTWRLTRRLRLQDLAPTVECLLETVGSEAR